MYRKFHFIGYLDRFRFWCHLDCLELGDLGPELEMEDGEDEEGEAEAQHQALHMLHPPRSTLLTSYDL